MHILMHQLELYLDSNDWIHLLMLYALEDSPSCDATLLNGESNCFPWSKKLKRLLQDIGENFKRVIEMDDRRHKNCPAKRILWN